VDTLRSVTKWLDADEMRAWRGLVDTFASVSADLENELIENHGLTHGDYGVLVQLSESPGRQMRMCDLAGRLHLSPSGLTRRLDGLVRDGLVDRVPAPDDRRVMMAELTQAGLAKLAVAAPDHVDGVRRHFIDLLSPAQIKAVGAAMAAVARKRAAADQ
jgi:DNA-binding MarR family transcriptional regulator